MGFRDRLSHAWNAFRRQSSQQRHLSSGAGLSFARPDRRSMGATNARTVVSSILTRIANDVSSVNWEHVRVNSDGHFIEQIPSGLNRCLMLSSNIDQNARDFKLDVVMSLLDTGYVAIVPVDTSIDPINSQSYDVNSMRVGKITAWKTTSVEVELYNDQTGNRETIWVPKSMTAIVENPFYSVMNGANSTLTRLNEKLALMDIADTSNVQKKLDLIIQFPYSIREPEREKLAEQRVTGLAQQLSANEYGIGYIDKTESVIQLNRSVENNLMPQIEYLTDQLYAQLGISKEVFDGTANEQVMLNYQNRVLEPILSAIVLEMTRKWITKTAYTQGQRITYYMDRFKLADLQSLADFGDKASRNEWLTPNEMRNLLGFKESTDANSDVLKNRNMSADIGGAPPATSSGGSGDYGFDVKALSEQTERG